MAKREEKTGKQDSLLKDNFLSVFHSLKFSKVGKDDAEDVDVDRRCLATQYMVTKKFGTEDETSMLLKKGLQRYQDQMGKRNGVNNYWPHIQAVTPKVDNDPMKWKSSLKDPKTALQFVKPLSCRTDNTRDCKHKQFTDCHIKEIVSIWKNGEQSPRNRKLPSSREAFSRQPEVVTKNNGDYAAPGAVHKQQYKVETAKQQKLWNSDFNSSEINQKLPKVQKPSSLMSEVNTAVFKTVATGGPSRGSYASNDARSNFKPGSSKAYRQQDDNPKGKAQAFKTASDELRLQQMKNNQMPQKRTLGGRTYVNAKFVCPLKRSDEDDEDMQTGNSLGNNPDVCEDERLRNIDPKMVELIKNEIMDSGAPVSWNDIAGLEFAKKTIQEIVVFPLLRPDIFTGLRRPPKGILLFGPPGTGKTLIGKCIASQSKSTFFSISASCLTSKWIGEGEKMVRALFAVARVYQPAVVFIDEIDSLLSQRSDGEHESSRRIKTEFLVQLDGAATGDEDRILVVGATNRPQELDEAARRRLVKRLYIPLPELKAREQIINNLLGLTRHDLTVEDVAEVAKLSDGYSGADVSNLCKEASMGPIRSIPFDQLESIREDEVRQVTVNDFKEALSHVRSSVSQADLSTYIEWERTYGTGTAQKYNS